MGVEWAHKNVMWWIVGAVTVGVLLSSHSVWRWKRRRDWVVHLDRLVQCPPKAGPVQSRATAEEHFLRGCAVLESRQPAAAVRHFQLAHHGNHAYELAAILTFTCMKMGRVDMPQLLRILLQTFHETSRSRIPSCSCEKDFLARIGKLSDPLPGELSAKGVMLWRLPISPIRQQLLTAREERFEWAAELFSESKPAPAVATAPA